MRLQRFGKKGMPFFHIVIADGRAPRDGRFIDRIGTYNPLSIPADIQIDFDKAVDWIMKGASPSDTVKAIMAYKGVAYKVHLLKGVKKGALSIEQAEAKFQEWLVEKEASLAKKVKDREQGSKSEVKKRFEAEIKVNEAKAKLLEKKRADAVKALQVAQEAPLEEVQDEVEVPVDEVQEEAPVAEIQEEVVAEVKEEIATEAPAEEVAPETEAKETTEEV